MLGLAHGLEFTDLYSVDGAARIDALFVAHLTSADAPLCMTCGTKMRPAGSCYVCEGCGRTSGCS